MHWNNNACIYNILHRGGHNIQILTDTRCRITIHNPKTMLKVNQSECISFLSGFGQLIIVHRVCVYSGLCVFQFVCIPVVDLRSHSLYLGSWFFFTELICARVVCVLQPFIHVHVAYQHSGSLSVLVKFTCVQVCVFR